MRKMFLPLAAIATLAVAACTSTSAGSWTYPPVTATTAPAAAASPAAASPAAASPASASAAPASAAPVSGDVVGDLEVKAIDLGFEPKEFSVDTAGTYAVSLTNSGQIPHDITFADGTKGSAAPGETVTVNVAVPDSGITFLCSIPGHAEAGMQGAITVAGSTAAASGADDHGGPAPTSDVQPDPNAPAYTLYPSDGPELLAGDTHDIDLVIEEKRHDGRPRLRPEGLDVRRHGPRAGRSASRSATRSASTSRTRQPTSWRTRSTSMPARSPGTTR